MTFSLSLKVQREKMCNVYSTAMDVSLKKHFLLPTGAVDQRLKCVNIFHVAHFLSYHLRITDTVSYETSNILVVAWLLLCATCAGGGGEGGRGS